MLVSLSDFKAVFKSSFSPTQQLTTNSITFPALSTGAIFIIFVTMIILISQANNEEHLLLQHRRDCPTEEELGQGKAAHLLDPISFLYASNPGCICLAIKMSDCSLTLIFAHRFSVALLGNFSHLFTSLRCCACISELLFTYNNANTQHLQST